MDWITDCLNGCCGNSAIARSLEAMAGYFIVTSVKVLFLLFFVSLLMGIINYYFPVDKLRDCLRDRKWYGAQYFLAALFGAITPFCACSSIPIFIGFVSKRIPLGVTLSFLITSPLINEVAVALFWATFGWKVTVYYVLSGLLLGTFGGWFLGRMNLEKYLVDWVYHRRIVTLPGARGCKPPKSAHLRDQFKDSWEIVKRVLPYVLVGVLAGAILQAYVPGDFLVTYVSKGEVFSVPLAVFIGIPMYSNAVSVVPVIQVLVEKGIPLGTAIAFMLSVVGLSFPEAILLKKVMTMRLIWIFFGFVSVCVICIGYLLNTLL